MRPAGRHRLDADESREQRDRDERSRASDPWLGEPVLRHEVTEQLEGEAHPRCGEDREPRHGVGTHGILGAAGSGPRQPTTIATPAAAAPPAPNTPMNANCEPPENIRALSAAVCGRSSPEATPSAPNEIP